MKTKLCITFTQNTANYCFKNQYTETYTDTDGTEKTRKREELISKNNPFLTIGTCENATSYFLAVTESISPKIAYTALRTVYTKTCNSKIYELMNECIAVAKNNPLLKEDFEQWLSSEYGENILPFMTEKQCSNKKYSAIQKRYAMERIPTVKVIHKYTMKTISNGKKYRVEIMPYFTQEKTQYGKVIDSVFEYDTNLDIYDIIYTAKLAICELFSFGLIDCPADIWKYKDYVYRKVSTYIRKRRTVKARENDYSVYTDKDGKQVVMTIGQVDKRLARVDKNELLELVKETIASRLDKRANKENVLIAFDLLYKKGLSTRQCEKILKVSQRQVSKYNKLIIKAIQGLNKEEYNIFYNALTDCINDRL